MVAEVSGQPVKSHANRADSAHTKPQLSRGSRQTTLFNSPISPPITTRTARRPARGVQVGMAMFSGKWTTTVIILTASATTFIIALVTFLVKVD